MPLPGADPAVYQVLVRVENTTFDELVDFAMILQVCVDNEWVNVLEIDCNHAQVHYHQCSLRAGGRVGDRIDIRNVENTMDILYGYDDAVALLIGRWEEYVERWRDE